MIDFENEKTENLGLDRLELMQMFMMYMVEMDETPLDEMSAVHKNFVSKLEGFIGRNLSPAESLDLLLLIQSYVSSDPYTKERDEVVEKITNLKFFGGLIKNVMSQEEKKQTPIDWFVSQVCHGGLVSKGHLKGSIEKAKQMFEEEIKSAYMIGAYEEAYGHVEKASEEYFNKTYTRVFNDESNWQIGKVVSGFKFEDTEEAKYVAPNMDEFVGKYGVIVSRTKDITRISFGGVAKTYSYPSDLITDNFVRTEDLLRTINDVLTSSVYVAKTETTRNRLKQRLAGLRIVLNSRYGTTQNKSKPVSAFDLNKTATEEIRMLEAMQETNEFKEQIEYLTTLLV